MKSLTPDHSDKTNITSNEWITHYNQLLNVYSTDNNNYNNNFLDYVKHSLPIIENVNNKGPLYFIISETDVYSSIKSLMNGKSVGLDSISNEMLKSGKHILCKPLCKLFNSILKCGKYPLSWSKSIIVPIYINRAIKCDVNNYRRIAISSCLSKVFTKIMQKRLNDYCIENNVISANQCGFREQFQTDDNFFLLNSIVQSYIHCKSKPLFVVFVDFKKKFDCINREILFYKLQKYGITGKFYQVIKSMYQNAQFCVKTENGVTKSFLSTTGVKQGCNLSPLLSNLYQNDLRDIFDDTCDPVRLVNMHVNSLSWADDLILLSDSQTGLQNCLNKLNDFCKKWHLPVNTLKTKCMVIRKRKQNNLCTYHFNNSYIEMVEEYVYLGITFPVMANSPRLLWKE